MSEGARSGVAVPPLAALFAAIVTILQPVIARVFGIASWAGNFTGDRAQYWPIGVTLMVWYAALAVVIGAFAARRVARRTSRSKSEILKAVVPAVGGAAFVTPVIAAMASGPDVSGMALPGLNIALSVPLGAALGGVVAFLALRDTAVATGLWLSAAWVWVLGFASVVVSWADDVRQTVPLGAAFAGGPSAGSQPIDQTVHDATVSILKMVSMLGPVLMTAALVFFGLRRGRGFADAAIVGLVGPVVVLASYLVRPDAISGANGEWFGLVVRTVLLSVLAAGVVWLFYSIFQPRVLTPADDDQLSPLVSVELLSDDAPASPDERATTAPEAADPDRVVIKPIE